MSQRIPYLYIASSNIDERGVFSSESIPKGSVIEICAVIIIPKEEMEDLKKTALYNYYFDWDEEEHNGAIALGYGSLYNHAYQPNAEYVLDYNMNTITFYAYKNIEVGEEITINYNGDPANQAKVWFDS